jgi:hypothetical protein
MKRAVAQAKSTKRFNTQVKNVMLNMEETKYKTTKFSDLPATQALMKHDSLAAIKLWEQGGGSSMRIFPQFQGDGQEQFIGREYYAKTLKIQLQFTFPYDRLGTLVKCWYVPVKTGIPEPTKTEFFQAVMGNVMIDPRNMQNYPYAKYLGSFRPRVLQTTFGTLTPELGGEIGGRPATVIKTWNIPFNKFFKLRSNVNGDGMYDADEIPTLPEKGFLVMTAYNQQEAGLDDTVVSNMEGVVTFSWKDP